MIVVKLMIRVLKWSLKGWKRIVPNYSFKENHKESNPLGCFIVKKQCEGKPCNETN